MRGRPGPVLGALAAVVVTVGCGAVSGAPEPAPTGAVPTSYDYRLTASCGERSPQGTFDVVVRRGEVVAAEGVHGYDGKPRLAELPMLADLVEKAETADDEAVVELDRDPAGRPVSLVIDHVPDALDDEECWEVDDLVVRPPR